MSVFEHAKAGAVRRLAAEILQKVDNRQAYADALLDHVLKSTSLEDRDRALLTEIVYGALRWRGRLDARLAPFLRRPLDETDPFIRNLLRITLYQLTFLERVPDYAAVNEAVELAKKRGGKAAAGFVNGVLRNILRADNEFSEPELGKDSLADFAAYWSHPQWLVERWLESFGADQIKSLLQANNAASPLVLRTNTLRVMRAALLELLVRQEIDAAPAPWSPEGVIVQSSVPVERLPGFADGFFQVQGEASQLVTHLLDPQPGERVLDACAAPGGKATHIAQSMGDRGQVIAVDVSRRGIELIAENARRLGLRSISPVRADATRLLEGPAAGIYDRVLVDAPCSGFGTLRSHPEIKWRRGPDDIHRLAELQKAILDNCASRVEGGGVLVYATCTLIEDENQRVVEEFLKNHSEFVLEDAARYLSPEAGSLVRGATFMALPHQHNTDGFFAARMRKALQ